jgi:hypothetical protein
MHINGNKYEPTSKAITDDFNSYVMTDEAETIIAKEGVLAQKYEANGQKSPFFMLFATPLIHTPLLPDEKVTAQYSKKLTHIKNEWRKKTAVMLIMLDTIVGRLVDALVKVSSDM